VSEKDKKTEATTGPRQGPEAEEARPEQGAEAKDPEAAGEEPQATEAEAAKEESTQEKAVAPQGSDLDFVADSKAAFLENKSPYASLMLFVIVGVVSTLLYWASTSTVDEITKGQGKIVPNDSLQVIQNLEGGILAELYASEGQVVSEGDPLLRLDTTASLAAENEVLAQRDSLMASIARLEAEVSRDAHIDFPPYLVEEKPDLVSSETELFLSRRESLYNSIAHLEESLSLKRDELEMTTPLAENGIVSQVELLRLKSVVNDTASELKRIQDEYEKDALARRNEAKSKFEQIQQSIIAFQDTTQRAVMRSPVDGIVNSINFNTIGGGIRPGEPILEIVPQESGLTVKADILPSEIGFLHPGQEVTVKLSAYDFSIYGGLTGEIERISADTFTNERGESFYSIRVRTGDRTLKTSDQEFKIIPGMQAEVDILTGEKTILSYILKPLMRARMNALTER